MIKKLTLTTLATMALLFIPAQAAQGMKCQAGKCGAGMTQKAKAKSDCQGGSCAKKGKTCKKGMKKGMGSPLLMPLPSAMRWIEKHKDNAQLALTAEQKTKLEAQRDKMMPEMMKLKSEISTVIKDIKGACKKGASAAEQKAKVEELAKIKTQTTMLKLTCIEGIKTTLSKEQWNTLKELRKSVKGKMKQKMQGKMNGMKKEMKCQAGKCASK